MTKYGVYIIESLRTNDYFDGKTLHEILELSKIKSRYKRVNSIDEFERQLEAFNKSSFRYLHVSCHSDEIGFEINGKELSNKEFQTITSKHLKKKRIFLSSCKSANLDIASKLILENDALSVIGTPIGLRFDKSVLFWPSFYHAMNEIDSSKMTRENIKNTLKKCVDLFEIPINYYSNVPQSKRLLWRLKIRHDRPMSNKTILGKL